MTLSRLACLLLPVLALSAQPALAGTSIVVDASTGAVLSSENPIQAWHPASTTKMMTAYLALKAVREGRIGLETAIPASKRAASQPRVKVYIKAGQEVTLDNALRIMMVKSANDIAYVIAEGVGGTVENFVAMMNAEAQRLGMRDSYFTNPNGWHDPNQQVSARDLAVLAMALMRDFPQYADYWNTPSVQLGRQVLNNTNGLVGRYGGLNGMKTGFVCASGFNVVATANRGGRTLIAVVMGAYSGSERTIKAAQLLDSAFGSWGGSGYTVNSLPAGSGGRAQSICGDLQRRGGGVVLADDAESSGPVSAHLSGVGVGGNAEGTGDRFPIAGAQAAMGGSVLSRTPSGRVTLGPRAPSTPYPVAFGRTAGSATAPLAANVSGRPESQVASGGAPTIVPGAPLSASLIAPGRTASANGAIPRAVSAFAPPAAEAEPEPAPAAAGSGPLRLQGAIQPGAAKPQKLRGTTTTAGKPPAKAASAAVKPAARPSQAQAAKPPAARPVPRPKAAPEA